MELAADALLNLADVVHDEGMEEAESDLTTRASTTAQDVGSANAHPSDPPPPLVGDSDALFEPDALEDEIVSLLNQDALQDSQPGLITDLGPQPPPPLQDGAPPGRPATAQSGMNLADFSAMIHTAQAQQTPPTPDPTAQPNTRSAPSFHSLAGPTSHTPRSYDPLAADGDAYDDALSPPPRKRQRREQSASESTDYFASDGALSGADNEDEWNDFALQLAYPGAGDDAAPSATPTMHMDDGLLGMDLFDPRFQTELSEEDDDYSPVVSSVRPQRHSSRHGSRPPARSSPLPSSEGAAPASAHEEASSPPAPDHDMDEPPRRIKKPKDENGYHVCEYEHCDKSFKRRSDMLRHMRIHSGERPYVCTHPGCGKTFIQRSALSVHARVHTGEKPHTCEYPHCGKLFADSSSLARHRRTHTGNRPFKCEEPGCDKEFTRRGNLNAHLRTHDPNYEPEPDVRYDASGKRKRKHSTANEDDESGEEDTKLMESVKTLSELLTGDERGITSISAELAAAIAEAQRAPAHPPTIYEVEDEHEQAPPDKDPVPLYSNSKEKGGRGARRRARRPAATSNPDDDGDGEDDEEDDVDAGAFIPTPLRTRRTTISTADR
ncbi:hypothetical protein EV715DRAFT_253787 [Schizophyllum commune]